MCDDDSSLSESRTYVRLAVCSSHKSGSLEQSALMPLAVTSLNVCCVQKVPHWFGLLR